jgi:hypothetical protein
MRSAGWLVVGAGVVGLYALDKSNEPPSPKYQPSYAPSYQTKSDTYSPSYDVDCADIGGEVYVGSDDPYGLDADGDGWGCESYGTGGSDSYDDPYYEDPYYDDSYFDDSYYDDPFYDYP